MRDKIITYLLMYSEEELKQLIKDEISGKEFINWLWSKVDDNLDKYSSPQNWLESIVSKYKI
jgi:hypothetical protein